MVTPVSLLQFADALFPIGGYAHSFGLEYYIETGRIEGPPEVQEWDGSLATRCGSSRS